MEKEVNGGGLSKGMPVLFKSFQTGGGWGRSGSVVKRGGVRGREGKKKVRRGGGGWWEREEGREGMERGGKWRLRGGERGGGRARSPVKE